MLKTIDQKIDDLALAMAAGFEAVDKKISNLKDHVDKKISNLPDKAYLDDKIADLKGDLVVKLRREDA